jgi:hypothetical protein
MLRCSNSLSKTLYMQPPVVMAFSSVAVFAILIVDAIVRSLPHGDLLHSAFYSYV